MFVTYDDYTELGYSIISVELAGQFPRLEATAENYVRRLIQNRPLISKIDEASDYNNNDPTYWSEQNKRGICEIIDLQYLLKNPNSDAAKERRRIVAFSNNKYSETYAGSTQLSRDEILPTIDIATNEIVSFYFTAGQHWRGF